MKKNIVLGFLFFCAIVIFAACETQSKCAAYGHYKCYSVSQEASK